MIQAAFRQESLDLIPMGVYIVDRAGVVQHYNQRAAEIWGRAPAAGDPNERFTGAMRLYATDGSVLAHDQLQIARMLADGRPRHDVEAQLERPDGSRVTVLASMGPLYDADGQIVGAINCFQDITDRKSAQLELRDSEERFRATFEQAAVGMAVVGLDGRWLRVNQKVCDITGYTGPELLARTFQDITHPEDLSNDLDYVGHLIAGRTTTYSIEKRYVRPDGSHIWVNLSVALVRDSDGTPRNFISVIEDVQERRRVEQELRESKRAAEVASAAKDQFLAALSHELRTPLTPVLMSASVLERDPSVPEHLREEMGIIRRNVELEARLIDDLLDLTRISRGKVELNCAAVDAHALLREAVQTACASDINNKRLDVRIQLDASGHHVWADPARLQQIFWNLIKNAVKFTPAGGSVSVSTRDDPHGRLTITIADTGIGIDPDVLPRIFDAFEQGGRDVTRHFGGLGLGLAISKALVDLHEGTLSAASEGVGKGATFRVGFAAIDSPVGAADGGAEILTGKPLRILLVEDHETTARVLGRLLRESDHEVHLAGSISAAHEVANHHPLDLLISDLGLPDGSGLDLMRDLALKYNVKGIALSGYGMDEDVRLSRAVGFATHLTKPVDFRKLQSAIVQITGR